MSNEQIYILVLFLALAFFFGLAMHYKKKADKRDLKINHLYGELYQEIRVNNKLKQANLKLTEGIEKLQKRIDNVDHVFFNETEKKNTENKS